MYYDLEKTQYHNNQKNFCHNKEEDSGGASDGNPRNFYNEKTQVEDFANNSSSVLNKNQDEQYIKQLHAYNNDKCLLFKRFSDKEVYYSNKKKDLANIDNIEQTKKKDGLGMKYGGSGRDIGDEHQKNFATKNKQDYWIDMVAFENNDKPVLKKNNDEFENSLYKFYQKSQSLKDKHPQRHKDFFNFDKKRNTETVNNTESTMYELKTDPKQNLNSKYFQSLSDFDRNEDDLIVQRKILEDDTVAREYQSSGKEGLERDFRLIPKALMKDGRYKVESIDQTISDSNLKFEETIKFYVKQI